MWHSIIESPNKGIFGDVNIFWGCVFEQLSPNLLSFKIPSISYDRRTPTPSVLSHRGEHTPSNVASIAEPNTNLFDCPTLVPAPQHSTKEHQWQHIIKKIAKGTTDTKALSSTLTHSTPSVQSRSFNKLWNLGQSSAWPYLVKGEKYIGELWQIHATSERNSCINFGKSI